MARIAHCRVGADRFAVDLSALLGIERTDRLQLAPAESGGERAAEIGWLLGAREDVPVHGLARLLGRPAAREARGSGVVLIYSGRSGAGRFGVLVDGIERSDRPTEAIHPLPELFLRWGIFGFPSVVEEAGTLSLLLDFAALVAGRAESREAKWRIRPGAGKHDGAQVATRPASRVLIADLNARSVGGQRVSIAFAAGQVAEVVEALPILQVPGAPAHLPGVILWRNTPLPVLDLARNLTGLGQFEALVLQAARFVVVAAGPFHVAVPVGREVRFERLPLPAHTLHLPPELAISEVLGSYDFAGSLLLVFDFAGSLSRTDHF